MSYGYGYVNYQGHGGYDSSDRCPDCNTRFTCTIARVWCERCGYVRYQVPPGLKHFDYASADAPLQERTPVLGKQLLPELDLHPGGRWHYITLQQLATHIAAMAGRLPRLSGIAGVPVSGMLAAPLLSTLLHVPLYEASDQHGLRPIGHGGRGHSRHVSPTDPILVLDDTVSSGGSIERIRQRLGDGNYLFGSVYCKRQSAHLVDLFGTYLEEPHLLAWNLPNTGYVQCLSPLATFDGAGLAFDFDGVLCPDPPRIFDETDVTDRAAYLDWLATAPLGSFVPRMFEIPAIVSYRCEYTREVTEAWLRRHGIRCRELHLWPGPPETRTWSAADWKGKVYASRPFGLFVESSEAQSLDIAAVSGKRVLCIDTNTVYG